MNYFIINFSRRIVRNDILNKPISIQNFIITWPVINLFGLDKQIKFKLFSAEVFSPKTASLPVKHESFDKNLFICLDVLV